MLRRRLMQSDKDFVDLGLPSGLKWARGNIIKDGSKYKIGAETDYGAHVSWGNIDPHFSSDDWYIDDRYSFDSESYKSTPGSTIDGEGLAEDSGYDAARELLGGKCKMPTKDDFVELNDNCTSVWVTDYNGSGVKGQLFTSKINGATLFFPAAGCGEDQSINGRGYDGVYWSRSLYYRTNAYCLTLYSWGMNPKDNSSRYYGCSVRAVK